LSHPLTLAFGTRLALEIHTPVAAVGRFGPLTPRQPVFGTLRQIILPALAAMARALTHAGRVSQLSAPHSIVKEPPAQDK